MGGGHFGIAIWASKSSLCTNISTMSGSVIGFLKPTVHRESGAESWINGLRPIGVFWLRLCAAGTELGSGWSSHGPPQLGEQEYGHSPSSAVPSITLLPMNPIAVIPKR